VIETEKMRHKEKEKERKKDKDIEKKTEAKRKKELDTCKAQLVFYKSTSSWKA
jgi:hypothetical protein